MDSATEAGPEMGRWVGGSRLSWPALSGLAGRSQPGSEGGLDLDGAGLLGGEGRLGQHLDEVAAALAGQDERPLLAQALDHVQDAEVLDRRRGRDLDSLPGVSRGTVVM